MNPPSPAAPPNAATVRLRVKGTVQGVGFRPFVYRIAREYAIEGWVLNDAQGVLIHAVASPENLARFEEALRHSAPPAARIEQITRLDPPAAEEPLPPVREPAPVACAPRRSLAGPSASPRGFIICESRKDADIEAAMPADLAVCEDCLREMRDPADRRYRYPFINCTNCGPRYSIIERIPYDRPFTTMREFPLCKACRAEYDDPGDRRFHAQPVACPECGPHLKYTDNRGALIAEREQALAKAIERLKDGAILAVKGIGGFHLVCDAANERSVRTLRQRKRREEKPLAILAPDLAVARELCQLDPVEEALLQSPPAPIVLAVRKIGGKGRVCDSVAPGNPLLGLMLPYSPLHYLLAEGFGGPLVATSGNLSEEPICIDDGEALERLDRVADGFLVHNRPIARAVDDSVVRVMAGEPVILRRARGYAPAPLGLRKPLPPLLAVGAHLKNTIAVTAGSQIFPSQHIGDLSTAAACQAFSRSIETLSQLYRTAPRMVACDLHPDYNSTLWAERRGLPVVRVQHHFAHVLACMAENHLDGPVLGVSWDGTGYGTDGTIWGGEWLLVPRGAKSFERAAHLHPFRLPGGEAAIHRPALTALGLLVAAFGEEAYARDEVYSILRLRNPELRILERVLSRGLNAPVTTSAGRLFDGVAALIGLGNDAAFEAQLAMKLEFLAMTSTDSGCYDIRLREPREGENAPLVLDWTVFLRQLLDDVANGVARNVIARRFHTTLAEGIAAIAREMPQCPVVLTGGCFQNKILTETTVALLRENGLEVYWHHVLPPNDGAIAAGQILAATARHPEPPPRKNRPPKAPHVPRRSR